MPNRCTPRACLIALSMLSGCGPGGQAGKLPQTVASDSGGGVAGSADRDRRRQPRAARPEPNVPFAMSGGGPFHHHRAQAPGPKREPVETDVFYCGGRITGGPVIGPDGTIYVGSIDGSFNAIGRDGRLRWSYLCDEPIFSTAAVSRDGKVYVGCDDDTLIAFSTSGMLRWVYRQKEDVDASPVIADDGVIYVGGAGLHAMNADGTKRFEVWLGGHVTAPPAVRPDGAVVVGSHDHRLYTVAPDGTVISVFETKGAIHGAAAVLSSNDVIVGSDDGHLYRLAQAGGLRWKFRTGGPIRAGVAISHDGRRAYTGSMDGAVYAVDVASGEVVWKTETARAVRATPILDNDGMLYVGSRDKHVYAMDQLTGDIRWRMDMGYEVDAPVAIPGKGRLIVADDSGALRLLEER